MNRAFQKQNIRHGQRRGLDEKGASPQETRQQDHRREQVPLRGPERGENVARHEGTRQRALPVPLKRTPTRNHEDQ